MSEWIDFLNANAGALSLLFSFFVAVSTIIYAFLTFKLVKETRLMREVQTEPNIEIVPVSPDESIRIQQLRIKNIGNGPALSLKFRSYFAHGGEPAQALLKDMTDIHFFREGLSYLGPGQSRISKYSDLWEGHEGKLDAVLIFEVTYKSVIGRDYSRTVTVDMRELKGDYQIGEPHLYTMAKSLKKIQEDIRHLARGHKRIKSDVYTSEDREAEAIERERQYEEMLARYEEEKKAEAPADADDRD